MSIPLAIETGLNRHHHKQVNVTTEEINFIHHTNTLTHKIHSKTVHKMQTQHAQNRTADLHR